MKTLLKPLDDQVIVINGASNGIGLAIARSAAEQGAHVALAGRSVATVEGIAEGIVRDGGGAIAIECDPSDRGQLQRAAQTAINHFGRIDTWVNNASIAICGRLEEVSDSDSRRMFETNFWGLVYGSLVALPHLKRSSGALINVGGQLSETSSPLGMYSASKHAVKAFTEALRMEVAESGASDVAITLIQPTADTLFPQHARDDRHRNSQWPAPLIDPQDVADAILHAAVHRTRGRMTMTEVVRSVGVGGPFLTVDGEAYEQEVSGSAYSERHLNGIRAVGIA